MEALALMGVQIIGKLVSRITETINLAQQKKIDVAEAEARLNAIIAAIDGLPDKWRAELAARVK
jgi:hypothetical protein